MAKRQAPERGSVVFFEHCPPPLPASEDYVLEMEHRIEEAGGTRADSGSKPLPAARQKPFAVTGPRFVLDPAEIHAAYPPPNAEGPFETRLPMVVLRRRTLPWERSADPQNLADNIPWVALMLIEDGEADILEPPQCTVGFIHNGDSAKNIGKSSIADDITKYHDRSCLGLQMLLSKFQELAPTREELKLLTHARQVNTEDKELLGQDKDGWFSVVVGNRLPRAGIKYTTCLVSLEGQLDNLPTDVAVRTEPPASEFAQYMSPFMNRRMAAREPRNGFGLNFDLNIDLNLDLERPPVTDRLSTGTISPLAPDRLSTAVKSSGAYLDDALYQPVNEQSAYRYQPPLSLNPDLVWELAPEPQPAVRLVVLAQWQFKCQGAGDFESIMKALPLRGGIALMGMNQDSATTDETVPSTAFKVALDSGHVPLNHLTRKGEKTTAFYRGPLVPVGVTRDQNGPYHCADQARQFDPLTGLENLGYAAAFEIGRLLALSDPRFALELLRWRRRGQHRVRSVLAREQLGDQLGSLLDLLDDPYFLNHVPILKQVFEGIGPLVQDGSLGQIRDPLGMDFMRDRLPGLDPAIIAAAGGFDQGIIEDIFNTQLGDSGAGGVLAGGVLGSSHQLDELGVSDELAGMTADFDTVLENVDTELGHLGIDHSMRVNNLLKRGV